MEVDYSSLLNYLHNDNSVRKSRSTTKSAEKDQIESRLQDIEADLNRIEHRLHGQFELSPPDMKTNGFLQKE